MFQDRQKQEWKPPRCCLRYCWREAHYRGLCREHIDESSRLTILVRNHMANIARKERRMSPEPSPHPEAPKSEIGAVVTCSICDAPFTLRYLIGNPRAPRFYMCETCQAASEHYMRTRLQGLN